jgi:hypothetical protein
VAVLKQLLLVLRLTDKEWKMPQRERTAAKKAIRHPLRESLRHHLIITALHRIPDTPIPAIYRTRRAKSGSN